MHTHTCTNHTPRLPVDVINTQIFHVASETFIQPQVCPPFHSDDISKPLN